jgi:hypothetical protein
MKWVLLIIATFVQSNSANETCSEAVKTIGNTVADLTNKYTVFVHLVRRVCIVQRQIDSPVCSTSLQATVAEINELLEINHIVPAVPCLVQAMYKVWRNFVLIDSILMRLVREIHENPQMVAGLPRSLSLGMFEGSLMIIKEAYVACATTAGVDTSQRFRADGPTCVGSDEPPLVTFEEIDQIQREIMIGAIDTATTAAVLLMAFLLMLRLYKFLILPSSS